MVAANNQGLRCRGSSRDPPTIDLRFVRDFRAIPPRAVWRSKPRTKLHDRHGKLDPDHDGDGVHRTIRGTTPTHEIRLPNGGDEVLLQRAEGQLQGQDLGKELRDSEGTTRPDHEV